MPTCIKCKAEFDKLYCKGKCKKCYTKDYREKNRYKIKEYREKWHAENPGKAYDYITKWRNSDKGKEYLKILRQSKAYKEYRDQWLSDNPDKSYEYIKKWRGSDKGKEFLKQLRTSEQYQEYLSKWKTENKELIRLHNKRHANTEKRKEYIEAWWQKCKETGQYKLYETQRRHQRRARLRNAEGTLTKRIVAELIDSQFVDGRGICPYCTEEITLDNCHLDHMEPLAKGGSNRKDNLIYCCPTCNLRKADKPLMEWLNELKRNS